MAAITYNFLRFWKEIKTHFGVSDVSSSQVLWGVALQDAVRTFLDSSELSRCQMHLQKAIEEKRQLEALVEALRTELSRVS